MSFFNTIWCTKLGKHNKPEDIENDDFLLIIVNLDIHTIKTRMI